MKTVKIELLVFRNFHIEFPNKKAVNQFNKHISSYMSANFPDQARSEYNTLDELLYATALRDALCKKVAELNGLKIMI